MCGAQHLKRMLEHDNCEVVMALLRVLSVLATPRSTRQVVCEQPFIAKLSALSSIFSGSANGPLSLAACCQDTPDEVILTHCAPYIDSLYLYNLPGCATVFSLSLSIDGKNSR